MDGHAQLIVIGGGIVGLATARAFQQRYPERAVIVLEKEPTVAVHQSGRNSGVIHSGVYNQPGSVKARTCRRGIRLLTAFCAEHHVPFEMCGKVIVATDDAEATRLTDIHARAVANDVSCEIIGRTRLRELEPHVDGVRAIHVHDAGIVDYAVVCRALAGEIEASGGLVVTGAEVVALDRAAPLIIRSRDGRAFSADRLVTCAGLQSDRVARLTGHPGPARIVPFRGEYFELVPRARSFVNNLVYPVPDPAFPFLGVHLTRMIDRDRHAHRVECGPNAVLALAREGYGKMSLNPSDLADTLAHRPFWKMASRHWRTGAGEFWRSWSKLAFVGALQRLVPAISHEHLVPAPAGIRAQALAVDGTMLDDFVIQGDGVVVNVINAPSPAATASLAIGELIIGNIDPI